MTRLRSYRLACSASWFLAPPSHHNDGPCSHLWLVDRPSVPQWVCETHLELWNYYVNGPRSSTCHSQSISCWPHNPHIEILWNWSTIHYSIYIVPPPWKVIDSASIAPAFRRSWTPWISRSRWSRLPPFASTSPAPISRCWRPWHLGGVHLEAALGWTGDTTVFGMDDYEW